MTHKHIIHCIKIRKKRKRTNKPKGNEKEKQGIKKIILDLFFKQKIVRKYNQS